MGERVVGRPAHGLWEQEAGRDRRLEIVGEGVSTIATRPAVACDRVRRDVAHADLRPDRPKVAQAEAPAEDRCVTEGRPGPAREACGPPVDERSNRRGDEPGRIAAESPLAVDLLERSRFAVGTRQLLDDEGDALGLDMHRGCG